MKNKKVLLAFVTYLLILTTFSNAQQNIIFGVETGGGMRSFRGSDYINDNYRPSFSFTTGLVIKYLFTTKVGLETAIFYERKGANIKIDAVDNTGNFIKEVKINYNLDYLTVPLNFIYYFGTKVKPYVFAGPTISYLNDAFSILKGKEYSQSKNDLDDAYNKFDYGINFGCGVAIPIKERMGISVALKDNLGLSEIEKIGNPETKNNTFHALIGFTYQLNDNVSEPQTK